MGAVRIAELDLPEKPANLPHPEYHTPRGLSPLEAVPKAGLQYPNYTPFKLPNLVERDFTDRGIGSDINKTELLSAASRVVHLTPEIGTELVGLQLAELNDTQKNELARLVAERGVVFFRDQEPGSILYTRTRNPSTVVLIKFGIPTWHMNFNHLD